MKRVSSLSSLFLLAGFLLLPDPSAAAQSVQEDLFHGMAYRNVGPSRGGRVTAVAGVTSRISTFYMGATGGGVWKTTDNGINWVNVSDGYFATGSIGAIRVSESNPDIVYVGTGSDGIRSNVITGKGVYRSDDAGDTWRFLGLGGVGQIGAVLIHPSNPDLVYVAAIGQAFAPNPERGVYRSTDGGGSWEQVLFVSDSTGAVDLEFAPDDPETVYASMWRGERKPWTIISGANEGGVYRSLDGGDSWEQLLGGLPMGIRGKSDLAVSAADPDRVYVLMEAPVGEGGVYRSDDRGDNWELVSTQASLLDRPFYYNNIDADPNDADVLYVNSTGYFKSEDGGRTWQRRRTPHGDNHDMWINPNNSNIFIQSNDGGANVTLDGGETWSTQHNQPTAELYQVDIDNEFPYWLYAGQQDNTTIAVPSLPPYSSPSGHTGYWREVGGCETGPAVPNPDDADIVYANCKGRFGLYNHRTGQEQQYYVGGANMYGHNPADLQYRFQRVSPIEVSPHNSNVVYHGSQFVHRTRDGGQTWETISPDLTAFPEHGQVISGTPITRDVTGEEFYSTLYVIEESPIEEGVIWTGSNDGPIHVTRDGGETWIDVTPEGLQPGGRVQHIDPSHHDPAEAYAAVYRYLLGDWLPYIYRTENFGDSWTLLTDGNNGIPVDWPTRVVREDPVVPGLLYAGTEFGIFVSFDDGTLWQSLQLNLPVTPITDLKIHRDDIVMSTMGRAFWILDDVSRLREIAAGIEVDSPHLFSPRDAYRMRYRAGGFGGRSPDEPEYPPPGVILDYYLPSEASGEVTLEIFDSEGNLVRAFSSETGQPEVIRPAEPNMHEFRLERIGGTRLDKSAGAHRFRWDMQYAGAWHEDGRQAGRNGPLAVPGNYSVRLNAGGESKTANFLIRVDPRVSAEGVTIDDLNAQFELQVRVRDALSRARVISSQVSEAMESTGSDTAEGRALASLHARLETAEGRYMVPMLVAQLGYLNGMISRADQRPGRDAYERLETLQRELNSIAEAFEEIR